MPRKARGLAAKSVDGNLSPIDFERRSIRDTDCAIDILYCGICHSDIHTVRGEWGLPSYPMIPGHEIVGRIIEVGSKVSKFNVGDLVGVGCLVDSCRICESCKDNEEQYCENGQTYTYNSPDKIGGTQHKVTLGGYSNHIVVNENFLLNIPENLELANIAPLLCAGITTYSPLKKWNIDSTKKVGIIGLGGLGHMGVKFANALGAKVVMLTSSKEKIKDAQKLGAHEVILSSDINLMKKSENTFDFLLNTIPCGHDVDPYLRLLKKDGTMVIVGAVEPLKKVNGGELIGKRRNLAGSLIGGIKETQEMLDFCGKHNITCDIETINVDSINEAFERTVKGDVKYRFVIDMSSI